VINDLPSTPRDPCEIMYLPPVDSSWAHRDTQCTAGGGEIIATHQEGEHDKAPWTPRH
jgi:hypothetical protein